jgi:hypothetical protein
MPFTSLWAILRTLGYAQISRDHDDADLVIAWHDNTFPKYPAFPVSRWGIPPINGRCRDISKRRVGEAFATVFGYELSVDPSTFHGQCVEKSNQNARHDVKLRDCPVDNPASGRVYERYVDSTTVWGYFQDIRIVVIGTEIPLCWRRIKAGDQLESRLIQKFDRSIPVPNADVLSLDEVRSVLEFCNEMGLDFCELDAGRDRVDGRLYIFDANSTPTVRRGSATNDEKAFATEELAAAFARQFQPRITYVP